MQYTGGGRAWQFLKKNPQYIVDWWMWAAGTPLPQGDPVPDPEADARGGRGRRRMGHSRLGRSAGRGRAVVAVLAGGADPGSGAEGGGSGLCGARRDAGSTAVGCAHVRWGHGAQGRTGQRVGPASVRRCGRRGFGGRFRARRARRPRIAASAAQCGRPLAHRGFERKEPRQRVPDWELLLALEMSQADESPRAIGKAIRKKASIGKGQWSDSDLRAIARRRIKKAEWLMTEGYLELAAGL